MADFFDTAAANNDTAKASLLQAIATQGSQAKAAFDQAQQAITQQRSAALAAAIAEAAQRGAPQAVQDQTTSTIGAGYDRRLADLSSAQASNAGSLANISARGGTYLTQANAAIPSLRARQDLANTTAATSQANRLASLKASQDMQSQNASRQETQFEQTLADRKEQRAAAAAAATQAAHDRQDRLDMQAKIDAIRLATAQSGADKAQTSAQQQADKQAKPAATKAPPTVPQLLAANFGNQQGFADFVNQATPQINARGQTDFTQNVADSRALGAKGNLAARADANGPGYFAPASNSDVAELAGSKLGFLPGVASSLIQPAATKATAAQAKTDAAATKAAGGAVNPDLGGAQVSKADIKAVSNTRAYKDGSDAAKAARAANLSADQLNSQMQAGMVKTYGHDFPKTRDVIVRMYRSGQL